MTDPAIRFLKDASARVTLTQSERGSIKQALQTSIQAFSDSSAASERQEDMMSNSEQERVTFLHDDERAEMRRRLAVHMERHPLVEKVVAEAPVSLFEQAMHFFVAGILPRTVAVACVFLLVGTSVTFAANLSVPGDMLYALKVGVIEEVRSTFAVTAEAKAAWEYSRALRRLREAEVLADRRELTEEAGQRLRHQFTNHVRLAGEHVQKTSAAEAISSEVEVQLRTHEEILQRIGMKPEEVAVQSSSSSANSAAFETVQSAVSSIRERIRKEENANTAVDEAIKKAETLLHAIEKQASSSPEQLSSVMNEVMRLTEEVNATLNGSPASEAGASSATEESSGSSDRSQTVPDASEIIHDLLD